MSYPNDKKETSTDESAREIEFAENFMDAAREMYLTENANPGRVGCFAKETIHKMANSAKLPDDSVMNHLFDCSECFRDYRQALMSVKQTIEESKAGWWLKLWSAKTALAGASLVLFIGLTIFWFWDFQEKQSIELAKNIEVSNEPATFGNSDIPRDTDKAINNQATKNDTKEQSTSPEKQTNQSSQIQSKRPGNSQNTNNSLTKKRPPEVGKTKPEMSDEQLPNESDSVNLVLSASNVLRNAANSDEKEVENNQLILPARKVNLNIKLPNNFSNGRYKLRIIDAFGNSLLEQKSSVKNRKLLLTNLNLQNLENRANKLCLQKSGGIPDCFDIKIAK